MLIVTKCHQALNLDSIHEPEWCLMTPSEGGCRGEGRSVKEHGKIVVGNNLSVQGVVQEADQHVGDTDSGNIVGQPVLVFGVRSTPAKQAHKEQSKISPMNIELHIMIITIPGCKSP